MSSNRLAFAIIGAGCIAAAGVGGYLLLVLLNFGYLYPVLAAKVIPYDSWHNRMWFTSCANPNQKHETAPCWI